MPIVASGTLVAAGVIRFLLHDIVANEELLGWCAAIAVLMAARLLNYRQFRKRIRDEQAVLQSARVFITLALV